MARGAKVGEALEVELDVLKILKARPAAEVVSQEQLPNNSTAYLIRVTNGERQHVVKRSYTDFRTLRCKMVQRGVVDVLSDNGSRAPLPAMPPKSVFRRACSDRFMADRQQDLCELLAAILAADPLAEVPELRTFLGLPIKAAPVLQQAQYQSAAKAIFENEGELAEENERGELLRRLPTVNFSKKAANSSGSLGPLRSDDWCFNCAS